MTTTTMTAAPTETITLDGVTYSVLLRQTPASHRARGLNYLADEMEKVQIVESLGLQRPRGKRLFWANVYASGAVRLSGAF